MSCGTVHVKEGSRWSGALLHGLSHRFVAVMLGMQGV
jgi:hypothetical protein